MFTLFEPSEQKVPIKIWLENTGQLDRICLEQAMNLANLPFAYQRIALMPDAHAGYGMPIGGILAAEGMIVPNAVGADIGCGMTFVQTNIPVEILITEETPDGKLAQIIVSNILRSIPNGYEKHKRKKASEAVRKFSWYVEEQEKAGPAQDLAYVLDEAYFQIGTLGGGNHFIELQTDEQGFLGVMVHTGSRNVGKAVCDYFDDKAKQLNMQHSPVPPEWNLAYLATDSDIGKEYIRWMEFAMAFAKENRAKIIGIVIEIIRHLVAEYAAFTEVELSEPIDCHHNYAAYEEHAGKMVWVHRKGAIRAGEGEWGIIPGAMGASSYLVKGKGNPESFHSCSHGAGRQISRKEAMETFSAEETILDLEAKGIFLGKTRKRDIGEEARFAYKNIDFVIANELDLIEPIRKLETLGVVKG
ncbi:trna-splicing ligase rtcb [Trichococcus palustris]|uniref:3'-phosphate/5'-hydroxy nucleic acid ligase n=1 Tax=Trichococcus palustris TaxID=140314 RepID=A0A143Y856_9LACT|nr:RtcB family protein [Trichococcus palustris]CZQ81892.1 trna-splicing ligase rtcb [Trichococcus palustris]SFK61486.1 tRNA-splicing ligase RtcB [Trichococcus palustris]